MRKMIKFFHSMNFEQFRQRNFYQQFFLAVVFFNIGIKVANYLFLEEIDLQIEKEKTEK